MLPQVATPWAASAARSGFRSGRPTARRNPTAGGMNKCGGGPLRPDAGDCQQDGLSPAAGLNAERFKSASQLTTTKSAAHADLSLCCIRARSSSSDSEAHEDVLIGCAEVEAVSATELRHIRLKPWVNTAICRETPTHIVAKSDEIGRRVERIMLAEPKVVATAKRTGRAELDEHVQGVEAAEIDVGLRDTGRPRAELAALRREFSTLPGTNVTIGQRFPTGSTTCCPGRGPNIRRSIGSPPNAFSAPSVRRTQPRTRSRVQSRR